jgi:HAD superfamily hydrolase (TIGR01549 family)
LTTERTIEAVLFDLGETLLNFGKLDIAKLSSEAVRRSYDYLKQCGQPVGAYWAYRLGHLWGIKYHVLKSAITGNDFDSLEILKNFGKRKGFTLTDDQWVELNWKWYEILYETAAFEPDVAETLTKLSDMGLKVGLLSNTFIHKTALERHMAEAGFLDCLAPRLYTYQYTYRKPDARIFRTAAEQIGVACENIIYIGDRIDNDVEGATKVGMLPIMKTAYTNKGKTPPAGTHVIDNISELPALIEQICQIKKKVTNTQTPQPVCQQPQHKSIRSIKGIQSDESTSVSEVH